MHSNEIWGGGIESPQKQIAQLHHPGGVTSFHFLLYLRWKNNIFK